MQVYNYCYTQVSALRLVGSGVEISFTFNLTMQFVMADEDIQDIEISQTLHDFVFVIFSNWICIRLIWFIYIYDPKSYKIP